MPLPAFLTSSLFVVPTARSLPVIASVVLHASLGVGLVASAGGHARAAAAPPVVAVELDLDAVEAPVLAPVEPPAAVAEALPAHTHAYPVAPSHDAHPHDPSLHHDEAVVPVPAVSTAAPAAAAPSEPAPALVADGATLPRFSLSSGSGAPMGAHVASGATGTGAGAPAAAAAANDETVHAASAVQAAARLVQSVTAVYPTHARADEIEGDVGVEIVVDREGRVVEARVTRPAGHGFDEAALTAVRGYRFSAAQREGRAVRVRMPWSVQFRLR